ncbi:hypothetical protein B0J11DRAFT_568251 [Dendryphion nanum]|uniref:Alcohol acetyltransferase n=1 Tax=Dendryphion nanum TaxID=256645 RepID=A0A9P9IM59_9PLEO|nr:hypothetical protein B0J11DRAFT_568251 [Dendryphion nanum]
MAEQKDILRYASPNEQRTISREDLGFYYGVIVGATYKLPNEFDAGTLASHYSPLRSCIEKYTYMSVVVEDMHTDKAWYRRVSSINMDQHITILEMFEDKDPLQRIEQIMESNLDVPFISGIPPWRVIVLPLTNGCFIAFSFSHTIGDGMNGTAFHRTFLESCRNPSDGARLVSPNITIRPHPLPAPFDTPERLPISWSFLLSPLLALFVPPFLFKLFNLRTSASLADAGTWTGPLVTVGSKLVNTRVKLREVSAPVLTHALKVARKHDAKFTGLFQQLVSRALSKHLADPSIKNFVSASAINMRKSIGISDDQDGLFASGCYIMHPRHTTPLSPGLTEEDWTMASSSTQKLAKASSTLQDQAIGLLRYAPSIRSWLAGKVGKNRDCSFEVSNLGAFHDFGHDLEKEGGEGRITQMVFSTPGEVLTGPLIFRLISVRDGPLVYSVSWKAGVLDAGGLDAERFVEAVCESIERDLEVLE